MIGTQMRQGVNSGYLRHLFEDKSKNTTCAYLKKEGVCRFEVNGDYSCLFRDNEMDKCPQYKMVRKRKAGKGRRYAR